MSDPEFESGSTLPGRGSSAGALAFYCLVAVSLMVADHHGGYLDRVRHWLGLGVYPVYQAVSWPVRTLRGAYTRLAERNALVARAEELERTLLLARAELAKLEDLAAENARLRALLGSSPRLGEDVAVAELMAVDLDPFSHRVVIDRGTVQGVYAGQPVADAGGILGQTESVTPLTAVVRLVTDPSHAIPVTVNRTGLRTIAYGTGRTDELVLRDVPRSADVRTGDLLLTSGLGGRFPPGFPVGRVAEIERDPAAAFLHVRARPLAAVDRSRQVLLVWPREGPEPPAEELAEAGRGTP